MLQLRGHRPGVAVLHAVDAEHDRHVRFQRLPEFAFEFLGVVRHLQLLWVWVRAQRQTRSQRVSTTRWPRRSWLLPWTLRPIAPPATAPPTVASFLPLPPPTWLPSRPPITAPVAVPAMRLGSLVSRATSTSSHTTRLPSLKRRPSSSGP